MSRWVVLAAWLLLSSLAACGGSRDDAAAIEALLIQEAQGVLRRDIRTLMSLWDEDGVITDAAHTPDDPTDDTVWRGLDAIRNRYVYIVFPGGATEAEPRDVQITIEGRQATAQSTTSIDSELSPGGDRWTFVQRGGRWLIASLTYNLEPAP
jgi:hypothetical protein